MKTDIKFLENSTKIPNQNCNIVTVTKIKVRNLNDTFKRISFAKRILHIFK